MEIKIKIKTPPGHAKQISKKIRPYILGSSKTLIKRKQTIHKETLKFNKKESIIIWEITCTLQKALKIQKNVMLYEQLVSGVFNSKMVKKMIRKKFNQDEVKEVEDMLFKKTSVKIIKEGDDLWEE